MRIPEVRSLIAATRFMCAIVILTSLTMLTPAYATLYTFTSPALKTQLGYTVPPGTVNGDVLTITFTYTGALPLGVDNFVTDFVMSVGEITLDAAAAPSYPAGFRNAKIFAVDAVTGAPSEWNFAITSGLYTFISRLRPEGEPPSPLSELEESDSAAYYTGPSTGGLLSYHGIVPKGVWVATPLPGTVLLFGTGLIPLAWARRKKRLGQ